MYNRYCNRYIHLGSKRHSRPYIVKKREFWTKDEKRAQDLDRRQVTFPPEMIITGIKILFLSNAKQTFKILMKKCGVNILEVTQKCFPCHVLGYWNCHHATNNMSFLSNLPFPIRSISHLMLQNTPLNLSLLTFIGKFPPSSCTLLVHSLNNQRSLLVKKHTS
jgi:hypothetical protein